MTSSLNFKFLRQQMVVNQLEARNITDRAVLAAFAAVPRHRFVPRHLRSQAYNDTPLPIGFHQTISQPYVVALACQLLQLKKQDTVLDVGTGSGYQAAILSHLAKQVISLEIIPSLANQARRRLHKLGFHNVTIVHQDGRLGYPPQAPYQAIISAAASAAVPSAWKQQLAPGGRIVFPQKFGLFQKLVKLTQKNHHFIKQSFGSVAFVPLI